MERNVFGGGENPATDSMISGMQRLSTTDTTPSGSGSFFDPRRAIQNPTNPSGHNFVTTPPPARRHRHRSRHSSYPSPVSHSSNPGPTHTTQNMRHSTINGNMDYASPLSQQARPTSRQGQYRSPLYCAYCRHLGHLLGKCPRLEAKHRRQERFQKSRMEREYNPPTDYQFHKRESMFRKFNDDNDGAGGLGGCGSLGSVGSGMKIFIIGGTSGL